MANAKSINKTFIPDGVYDALWSAYTIIVNGYTEEIRVDQGIRGVNFPVEVTITNGWLEITNENPEPKPKIEYEEGHFCVNTTSGEFTYRPYSAGACSACAPDKPGINIKFDLKHKDYIYSFVEAHQHSGEPKSKVISTKLIECVPMEFNAKHIKELRNMVCDIKKEDKDNKSAEDLFTNDNITNERKQCTLCKGKGYLELKWV